MPGSMARAQQNLLPRDLPVPVQATPARHALAVSLPAGLPLGTSSWSSPGWQGIVYARSRSDEILEEWTH